MSTAGRSERDEAVDRVFAQVEADMAERLSRPPTEEEIARDAAALDLAERLQRLREQAGAAEDGAPGWPRAAVALSAYGRAMTSHDYLLPPTDPQFNAEMSAAGKQYAARRADELLAEDPTRSAQQLVDVLRGEADAVKDDLRRVRGDD